MAQRLMHEKKFHDRSAFVTLTYNDEHLPAAGSLVKRDVQLFMKRLRKKRKVRYYLAGEYGDVGRRPHYHAIIFGVGVEDLGILEQAWGLGFVDVKKVEFASCAYVARYVVKKQKNIVAGWEYQKRGVIPEFCVMSRRPGIGAAHVAKYKDEIFNRGFMLVAGHKAAIPKYYVSKVYDTEERLRFRAVGVAKMQANVLELRKERERKAGVSVSGRNGLLARSEAAGRLADQAGSLALKRRKL